MGQLTSDRIDGIRLTRLDSGLIVATDAMAGIETAALGGASDAGNVVHVPSLIHTMPSSAA